MPKRSVWVIFIYPSTETEVATTGVPSQSTSSAIGKSSLSASPFTTASILQSQLGTQTEGTSARSELSTSGPSVAPGATTKGPTATSPTFTTGRFTSVAGVSTTLTTPPSKDYSFLWLFHIHIAKKWVFILSRVLSCKKGNAIHG